MALRAASMTLVLAFGLFPFAGADPILEVEVDAPETPDAPLPVQIPTWPSACIDETASPPMITVVQGSCAGGFISDLAAHADEISCSDPGVTFDRFVDCVREGCARSIGFSGRAEVCWTAYCATNGRCPAVPNRDEWPNAELPPLSQPLLP